MKCIRNSVLTVCLLIVLSSCSVNSGRDDTVLSSPTSAPGFDSTYNVLICDFSDSGAVSGLHCEYSFWCNNIADSSSIPQIATVEVNGQTFRGTFDYHLNFPPNNYTEYQYSTQDVVMFSTDAHGNLTSYRLVNPKDTEKNDVSLTQDQCLKIAKSFMMEFVDTSHYQIKSEFCNELGEYRFAFTKYIGEYETADSATIYVSPTGEVTGFYASMLGKIPVSTPIEFDVDQITASINNKLNLLYADAKNVYDKIERKIEPQYVTILEDGQVALIVNADLTCTTYYQGGYSSDTGALISFVVPLSS